MGFNISPDKTERSTDYDISDNFLDDFIRFSRANQVLNEQQAAVVQMSLATGLMADHTYYTSAIVTGGFSSGKSHMLDKVNMAAFEYADDVHEWVYELTGGSDQAGINDPAIDDSRFAYFHELQKIPDEMLEFVKTIAEDGEFRYGRSQADSDADGGFATEHIERDPLPVIFSFADENTAGAGKDGELRSRLVEVKVDESPTKNAAVHDTKWGGEKITIGDAEAEYIEHNPDMEHAVKAHIRDMPTDVDVVIPYGDGDFEGDDWRAASVVKPLFNFERNESTRASANLAGLTMGSAILNYHSRNAVCENCTTVVDPDTAQSLGYECDDCSDVGDSSSDASTNSRDGSRNCDLRIIVEPTDVGNLLMCRNVLLATTHGLTEKKFAIIDAIVEGGHQDGERYKATKQQIIEAIQVDESIPTLSQSQIDDILDELDENLIINKRDNPEDRRENLYIYDGGSVFKPPAIDEYPEKFDDVYDPIRDQPIAQTVADQLEQLNARMNNMSAAAAMGDGSDGAESGSETLESFDDASPSELSETAQRVAERLHETLDGETVHADAIDDLTYAHMVGVSPVETVDGYLQPERPPNGADKQDDELWDPSVFDVASMSEVKGAVGDAIAECRREGVFEMDEQSDGHVEVTVDI